MTHGESDAASPNQLAISRPSGTDHAVKDAARQLRKVLGISQDFDDWPLETLILKAVDHIIATQPTASNAGEREALKEAEVALRAVAKEDGPFMLARHALRAVRSALASKPAEPVAPPAPPVLHGFDREDLETIASVLEHSYEKTINVGNTSGVGDEHIESTTAYAARFIRAALSATPPARAVQDSERLDYLQNTGSTVEILPGIAGWRFRIGGAHKAVSNSIHIAIDEARTCGNGAEPS